jgi:hypothetical protein
VSTPDAPAPETPVIESIDLPPELTEALHRLRGWVLDHLDYGHPVRTEMARAALSASIRRLVTFGVEDGLSHHSCRDVLQFQAMVGGQFALYLARIAFTRALIENDREIIDVLTASGLVDGMAAWRADLIRDDLAMVRATLDSITDQDEELHVGRLIAARRHPELVTADWLEAVPERLAQVAAQMCRAVLGQRPDLTDTVRHLLARRTAVLMALDPDLLLAPLVLASSTHPQALLAEFAGYYGECTVAAAAEWHLEHDEPGPALELAARIRPLSEHADHALLVAGLALIGRNRAREAVELHGRIGNADRADALAVRLAEALPESVTDDSLHALAERGGTDRPERFFTVVRLLLARRRLDLARDLCRMHRAGCAAHPELAKLAAVVLKE